MARPTGALLSGWTVLAAVGTVRGFIAFQAVAARGPAVNAIALMNVFAALVALALGVLAFGESLGTTPAASVVHLLAIAVVLGCVPVLATGQGQIADGAAEVTTAESRPAIPRHRSVALTLRRTALGIAAIASRLVSVLVGAGLLYGLRGLGWLAAGPMIRDALPLLQLPGFDGQPLARVLVALLGRRGVRRRADPHRRRVGQRSRVWPGWWYCWWRPTPRSR